MEGKNLTPVKNLANHLLSACEKENLYVDLELCQFLVSLKLLQFTKTTLAVGTDKDLTQFLIEKCLNDLRQNSVRIIIFKLQQYWETKHLSKEEVKKNHHENVLKSVHTIMADIVEGSLIKTVDKENVYKKIVIFIIMFAGLGNPTYQPVITETQAALNSIFKVTEMENFLNLSNFAREQQLLEFARLVTGIRLFNKDCKKGGEGIEDLPLLLNDGIKATKDRIISFKEKVEKRTGELVETLSHVLGLHECYEGTKLKLPQDVNKLEETKMVLIYFRQLELCLRDLMKDVDESLLKVKELIEKLQTTLLHIHDVVRYRVAIATIQVFPLFLQLSSVWVEMQEEVNFLSEINNNFEDLNDTFKLQNPTPLEFANLTRLTSSVSTGWSEISEIAKESTDFHSGVKICSFSSVSEEQYLQYEGFCAWTLAYSDGILLMGNIAIGVLFFENCFYSFSSPQAACNWAKDPKYYINQVIKISAAKSELIKLLKLGHELEMADNDMILEDEGKQPTENAEVQTELHPIDSYIDKDYTASEWEIKRRAIKMAKLTKYVTKSQQTIQPFNIQPEIGVQTMPEKSQKTQTMRQGSSRPLLF